MFLLVNIVLKKKRLKIMGRYFSPGCNGNPFAFFDIRKSKRLKWKTG